MLPTKPDSKCCSICGKHIGLEHCTKDEHGLFVHTSCQEKQVLLQAATRQVELWRQNLARRKTA